MYCTLLTNCASILRLIDYYNYLVYLDVWVIYCLYLYAEGNSLGNINFS